MTGGLNWAKIELIVFCLPKVYHDLVFENTKNGAKYFVVTPTVPTQSVFACYLLFKIIFDERISGI